MMGHWAQGPKKEWAQREHRLAFFLLKKTKVLWKCTWGKRRSAQSDSLQIPLGLFPKIPNFGKDGSIPPPLGLAITSCLLLHYYHHHLTQYYFQNIKNFTVQFLYLRRRSAAAVVSPMRGTSVIGGRTEIRHKMRSN